MAICTLSKDILRGSACGYSLKQIKELYLANYDDVTATTLGEQMNTVKTITMKTEKKFYKVQPQKDSASYDDALTLGDGGSKYRVPTITFNISGEYNADMHDTLDALSLGRYVVVARFTDDSYVMFGRRTPMEASAASLQSAAEATGFNGITVTLTANTDESALPLEAEAVTTVTGAGAGA